MYTPTEFADGSLIFSDNEGCKVLSMGDLKVPRKKGKDYTFKKLGKAQLENKKNARRVA